jgi:hypothetical protein
VCLVPSTDALHRFGRQSFWTVFADPSQEAAMNSSFASPTDIPDVFELRFQNLRRQDAGFVFPCDAQGLVDLDRLDERARIDYFYARCVIGREVAGPRVRRATKDRR